ncbi:MAG: VOC family protein [Fimbriimonadaceae bacterium]|nr:VOC family protein [Fimbriimonadaceae bacterium]QYK55520.1 MAG: VOC family protein [Fimbriimonadaceae bacterium]
MESEQQAVTPMLAVRDAEAAIEFYRDVFGAEEIGERHPYEGKIGHAELRIGTGLVMLADELPEFNVSPESLGGTPVILHLEVQDVDGIVARAEVAGAVVVRPPENFPYGRTSKIRDPYGHVWMLNGPVDVQL